MSRQVTTDRFHAQLLKGSFYEFFREFWPLIAAEKLNDAWYIQKLCTELQVISERVFNDEDKEYDLIWNCPPGTTKSSVVSRLWQPWIWTRMPSARFISGSYSERLALDLSRHSRDVITSEKYRRLFPEIQLREDQNTKGYFANTQGGIRYAVGVGGTVIGFHAHFIAIDDPIDPQAALSDLLIAESNNWMNETLSRRKVRLMLTPTVMIMQRLHQDDPTGNRLEQGKRIKHCCIPCDLSWDVKPKDWRELYSEDGLLDPIRLPLQALEDARDELGEVGYAGQYGQNPVPRGGAMFHVDRLLYEHAAPIKWKRKPIRAWDKASTKGGGAFTVGVKLGIDTDDRLWVLDIKRDRWDTGTREKMILETARTDGKSIRVWIEEEPGSGGKHSADATIKMLTRYGFSCKADRPSGDKELRADVFSQYVNTFSCVILQGGPWVQEFVKELRFFPRSKYKDQVDACSGGCNVLSQRRICVG